MTTSTAVAPRESYQLIAIDGDQLQTAHGRMADWVKSRIAECETERAAELENIRIAQENHWASAPFKRRVSVLEKRIGFYSKIRSAIDEGYVIIPNFPMDIFAIRTNASAPRFQVQAGRFNSFPQSAQLLPEGGGEYVNPLPNVITEHDDDGKGGTIITQQPADEWNDVEFPIALARPQLMEKTAQAMALRLFDEIGVARDHVAGGDPIILGRIRNPRNGRPDISFFIGWFFDPSRL